MNNDCMLSTEIKISPTVFRFCSEREKRNRNDWKKFAPQAQQTLNVFVVGSGNVTRSRVRPAIQAIADETSNVGIRAMYFDIQESSPFQLRQDENVQEFYQQINPDCVLPYDTLNDRGFMNSDLAVVALPTSLHGRIAMQAASIARWVAVDKPISSVVNEARAMSRIPNICGLSHFLAKTAVSRFWELNPKYTNAIDAYFMETMGVGKRILDPSFEDLGYHQAAFLLGHFPGANLIVDRCVTMTYQPNNDAETPHVTTAARIEGIVEFDGRHIPFRIIVGKGFEKTKQEIHIHSREGVEVISQTGDSPNWLPYKQLLKSLLIDNEPQQMLPMEEHLKLVQFCARAACIEEDAGHYEFGASPPLVDLELVPELSELLSIC